MNILITGGCGFVGSSLAIYLKKKIKNIKITSLDNLYRKGSEINLNRLKKFKIKNIKKDISDEKNLLSLNKFDLKTFPQNFPINTKNLTGCLSFINTKLDNANFYASNSN